MTKWFWTLSVVLFVAVACSKPQEPPPKVEKTEVVAPAPQKFKKSIAKRQVSKLQVAKVGKGSADQCKTEGKKKWGSSATCRPINTTETHIVCECSHF